MIDLAYSKHPMSKNQALGQTGIDTPSTGLAYRAATRRTTAWPYPGCCPSFPTTASRLPARPNTTPVTPSTWKTLTVRKAAKKLLFLEQVDKHLKSPTSLRDRHIVMLEK